MMATALRLYETVDALEQVEVWLAENDSELTPELEQLLDAAGADFADKVERVAGKITELRATAKAQREESDRLAARAKASGNAADRLARYLEAQLERSGRDKVAGTRFTVALQRNPPCVVGELTQEQLGAMAQQASDLVTFVPGRYTLNRRAVIEDWKRDGYVPEGLAVEQHRSLRIR